MTTLVIWRVALPTPRAPYFDYLPPVDTPSYVRPGIRVRVPLGARVVVGILLAVVAETELPLEKLKVVCDCLDEEPVLDDALMKLCYWVSDYYHYAMGEVLMTALPKRLREGKSIVLKKGVEVLPADEVPLPLNEDQQRAMAAILACERYRCFVLAGVTGSGKTEVYLQVIANVLERQQQALLLVPEISLTPQTIERVARRFAVPMAVMHSRLTEVERGQMWLRAKRGEVSIVIGTRSAVFAPLSRLGVIIVDEEHDPSFKSQSGVRYSARDLAVIRAHQEQIPVILGSATPSLETYYNAQRKRYALLVLPERAGDAQLPKIQIMDVRQKKLQSGMSFALLEAIKQQLARKKQVLLFINRRGYAPILMCHACGYVVCCSRCDARMTFHAHSARLVCHHCEKIMKPSKACPKCHQAELITLGQGTEQIEAALAEQFPAHTVLRIDRDTTSKKHSLHEKLAQINACEADILVGTQLLAKGHHFENLGLSAILEVDSAFFSTDFRAMERMAQLLVQVSGRAGRGKEMGEVIIQTHHPEHPDLVRLFEKDYLSFLDVLLQERAAASLPPFCYQALLRAEAARRDRPIEFLKEVKPLLSEKVVTLGPMPAMMERRAGKFRQQLLIQSPSRRQLQEALQPLIGVLARLPSGRKVRWSMDVDPLD